MSTTLMNRADAVLVVIDVQERLATVMSRREQVLGAATFLCEIAGITGVDVIATRQYPAGLGDIEPRVAVALAALETGGARIAQADKVAFDCFGEPAFCDALAATGRRQLLLVGMDRLLWEGDAALDAVRVVGSSAGARPFVQGHDTQRENTATAVADAAAVSNAGAAAAGRGAVQSNRSNSGSRSRDA